MPVPGKRQQAPNAVSLPPTLAERDALANRALALRFDVLNQWLGAAETRLKALKPPRDVWRAYNNIQLDPHVPAQGGMVGIAKIQDKWRLAHGYYDDAQPDAIFDVKPLIECPIQMRIEAAWAIRDLCAAIVEAKEQCVPEVDAAIAELTNFCNGQ